MKPPTWDILCKWAWISVMGLGQGRSSHVFNPNQPPTPSPLLPSNWNWSQLASISQPRTNDEVGNAYSKDVGELKIGHEMRNANDVRPILIMDEMTINLDVFSVMPQIRNSANGAKHRIWECRHLGLKSALKLFATFNNGHLSGSNYGNMQKQYVIDPHIGTKSYRSNIKEQVSTTVFRPSNTKICLITIHKTKLKSLNWKQHSL